MRFLSGCRNCFQGPLRFISHNPMTPHFFIFLVQIHEEDMKEAMVKLFLSEFEE